MRRIFLLILALASPAHAGEPFSTTFAGAWHGVGIQSDGSSWEMQATLGPIQGAVRYPGLQCGGRWAYADMGVASLSGVETIEYGLENCIETGNIYLQPHESARILFMWCGEEDGVSALAVLTRDSAPNAGFEAERAASQAALDGLEYDLDRITCRGKKWLGV